MMNSGDPITGIDRRPLNSAGMDIRSDPQSVVVKSGTVRSVVLSQGLASTIPDHAQEMPDVIPTRQSFQCQVLRFGAGARRHFLERSSHANVLFEHDLL
jgi:hypothetical protein